MSVITNYTWTKTVISDGLPSHDLPAEALLESSRVAIVQLLSSAGVSFYQPVTPYLRLDIDTPWLENCSFRKPLLDLRTYK